MVFARYLRGSAYYLLELFKVRRICFRDSAEFQPALSPVKPLETLPGPCARGIVPFPCGPDEYIDWTSVALVDHHRDIAAFNGVQAPAVQCETPVCEISHRDTKTGSAVEPSLNDPLIVRCDAGHLPWLQRAHVRLDNFPGKFGLVVIAPEPGTCFPQDDADQEHRGGRSQPVPEKRLRHRLARRYWVDVCVNCPPQRRRSRLIELRQLQAPAQQIQVHQLRGAVGAMLHVALEFVRPTAAQLAIEVALQQCVGKVTPH